jgi:hypothetical protein
VPVGTGGGPMDHFDRAKQHDLEHLPLAVAAAQTYYLVVGDTPRQKSIAHLDRILNTVAHAITNVAPLFVAEGTAQRQISPLELLQSHFARGATILKLHDGTELRGITVRRIDVREAVTVLRAVKARFDDD